MKNTDSFCLLEKQMRHEKYDETHEIFFYDHIGRNLVFGNLVNYIEQSPDRGLAVLEIAFWLSQPAMQEGKSWATLALQFFRHYRPDLDKWYGRKGLLKGDELLLVKDPSVVIDFVGGMKKSGHLSFNSYKDIARVLKEGTDIPLSLDVLERRLADCDPHIFVSSLETYQRIYLK